MFEDFRLRVFKTVCELGSFTQASRELGVSQPAVSQNISELERQIGVKLFERTPQKVSLTAAGEKFERYAEEILHWYQVAWDAFSPTNPLPDPAEVEVEPGRTAQIWTHGGDIHIHFKD